jgi:hypothetical protein
VNHRTDSTPPLTLNPQDARKLRRIRRLTRLMDQAFRVPGTSISVGVDSLVGLFPVVGDIATVAASIYMVRLAKELGIDPATARRMYANIAIDCVGGFVPVIGDLFDVAWKANVRNLRLLEQSLAAAGKERRP